VTKLAKKVAVIKGDGTGPELVDAMSDVLKACNSQTELIFCEAGSEQWEKHGGATYIPDKTAKIMEESDACFKGPTTTIPRPDAPRSVAVSTRQKFNLYANVRPIKTYDRLSPDRKLDFVCFREATEGLYAGIEFKTSEVLSVEPSSQTITRSTYCNISLIRVGSLFSSLYAGTQAIVTKSFLDCKFLHYNGICVHF